MIHKIYNYQLSLFNFFTDTDENEKTISQSSALGREEIGQDKDTERKRKLYVWGESIYWQNNPMPTDMVLKLFIILFWPSKVLNCTYVGQKKIYFSSQC